MNYITNTDVATYLDIELSENAKPIVDSLINAVEETVDNYTGRTWKNDTSNITEKFDGGVNKFFVAKPTIDTIVSVNVNGSAFDLSSVYNYGTYILLDGVVSRGYQNVEITYTTKAVGDALPKSIKQAVTQWVAEQFKAAEDAGRLATEVVTGPMRVMFKSSEDDMPDYVRRVLDQYKLIAL